VSVQQLTMRRESAMLDLDDGRYLDAERQLTEVIDAVSASTDPGAAYELGRALIDRATARRLLNRWADARADLDACEALVPSLPRVAAASLQANVDSLRAQLLMAPGSTLDPTAAREAVDALVATGSSAWWVRLAQADLAFREKDWERAADLYVDAARDIEREGWARGTAACELLAGTALLELDRDADAGPRLQRAAAFFGEFGPSDMRADAERQLARLLTREGRPDDAWTHATTALALVETSFRTFRSLLDQQRFLADKDAYYQHAFSVGLAAGGVEGTWRALAVAERAKSFYLCQLLANADVPLFDGVDPSEVERLRTLEDRLDELQRQATLSSDEGTARANLAAERDDVAAERDELFARIMREHPRWAAARTPPMFDPVRDLDALPSDWSALSMFWLGPELHFFLIRPGEPPFHSSETWTDDDREALRDSQERLRRASPTDLFLNPGVIPDAFAQRLVRPEVLERIPTGDRLLVSPHGELKAVPLQALPLRGRAVQYVPSLSLLNLVRPAADVSGVLLLGCEQDGFQNRGLSGVPRELDAVAEEWGKPPAAPVERVLLGPESRLGVDAPSTDDWGGYRVVHLACHGQLDPDRPLEGSLLLGQSALRMSELFALRLQADLVCLSACDLGRLGEHLGDVKQAGDEWLGFTMPLLYAGARSILVSLWQADDKTASRVMPAFHRAIHDGREPADALRDALATVDDAKEAHWSNWYLVGFPAGLTAPNHERGEET
jgi:tetratricopeptide (TPR) repeat protein